MAGGAGRSGSKCKASPRRKKGQGPRKYERKAKEVEATLLAKESRIMMADLDPEKRLSLRISNP
jgi:hypothetical protein